MKGLTLFAVLVLIFSFSVILQAAETTASVYGKVTDDKGAPLPGATVTAVNTATNFTRVATSESDGSYRLPLLPPGTYDVSVEVSGFAKEVRRGIVLNIGKDAPIDYQLKLGAAAQELEVIAETPLVDTVDSGISQVVDQTAIRSLPLNGRDYTQLSLLAPGVRPVTLTNYGQFQIGGQRGDAVNYTIDGAENNFSYTNEARSRFTQEGIREFQILTNRFSAEYGRSTSGVLNVVSKSGTNELHGNGFFFFRADELDSQDFFSREAGTEAPFDQQQGGFTLGGPIVRDKTFFFSAYEQVNTDRTLSVSNTPETPDGLKPRPIDQKLLTVKVDHNLNNDHSMVFRYNLEDRSDGGFYAGGRYVDGVDQTVRAQSLAVSENAVLSDDTYNEFLVQYGRYLRVDTPEREGIPAEFRPSAVTGQHYCCPQRFLENRFEVADNLTRIFDTKNGEHSIKVGADYIFVDSALTFAQYVSGAFFFTTDDPFDRNDSNTWPTFLILGVGDPTNNDTNHQFSAYIQDDWRVNDKLTLNLGLRYDIETFDGPTTNVQIPGLDVVLGAIPPVDKNNFGPRVGFTYDPFANEKTVFRGGYGRYYKPILHNVYNNALLFDDQEFKIRAFADAAVLAQFYPNLPPAAILDIPSDVRPMESADVAYTDQISFGAQHELSEEFAFTADYVYVRGSNLTRERNLNAPQNLVNPEPPAFPQFGRFRLLLTDAHSWYHGLQLGLQKRYRNNFMFTASYTLSKVDEEAADFFSISEPNDQFNLDTEKGPGAHDQRHVFAFSGVYDLPAGFQVSSIFRAASGIPINFVLSNDHNSDGFLNDRPDLGANGEFLPPPPNRPGNLPRNFGRGDNFYQIDVRLAKNFTWDRYTLELIAEVFNLFNRDNFNFRGGTVNRFIDFSDPSSLDTLGTATEAFDPRQVQFGVKFNF